MKWDDSKHRELTSRIIKQFYIVHDVIGCGFVERVYQNALEILFNDEFETVYKDKEYPVFYKNTEVGIYKPDFVIENKVVVEIKAVKCFDENHKAQLIAQLRATNLLIGFLVNFGKADLEFRRYDNYYELERRGLLVK